MNVQFWPTVRKPTILHWKGISHTEFCNPEAAPTPWFSGCKDARLTLPRLVPGNRDSPLVQALHWKLHGHSTCCQAPYGLRRNYSHCLVFDELYARGPIGHRTWNHQSLYKNTHYTRYRSKLYPDHLLRCLERRAIRVQSPQQLLTT